MTLPYYCISKYPASAADANLTFINDLQKNTGEQLVCPIIAQNTIAAALVALGVRVIENTYT